MTRDEAIATGLWMSEIGPPLGARWDASMARWVATFRNAASLPAQDLMAAIAAECHEWQDMERHARRVPAPPVAQDAERAVLAWLGAAAAYGERWLGAIERDLAAETEPLTRQLNADYDRLSALLTEATRVTSALSDRVAATLPPVEFQA